MKKTILITVVLLTVAGVAAFLGYRIGVRKGFRRQYFAQMKKVHKAYVGTAEQTNAIPEADLVVVELGDGNRLTLDLRSLHDPGEITIWAGEFPPSEQETNWHSFLLKTSCANVLRLAVESHPRQK